MKFLVYGGRGWIGSKMVALLQKKQHTVVLGQARLDNYAALCQELDDVAPDRVFSSVGRTHGTHSDGTVYKTIDFLELPGNLRINLRDNFIGPQNLSLACRERALHCAYMGTGCIFVYDEQHLVPDYTENQPFPIDCSNATGFTEEDKPNFFGSGYSTVKGQTDEVMHMQMFRSTVLNWRIRMPISAERDARDFITKISTYEKVCSIPNSMTVLSEILPVMLHQMERAVTGTYNMCNPGVMSHNQILDMYQQLVNNNFVYSNFTEEEQAKILLSGRSNNYLDTGKLQEYCAKHGLVVRPLFEAVQATLQAQAIANAAEWSE